MRRPRLQTVGLVTGIAAFTATVVLALTHNSGAGSRNAPPNARRIAHAQIQLNVGSPLIAPARSRCPKGP